MQEKTDEVMKLTTQEKETFLTKYRASKDVIQKLQTEKKGLEAKLEEMRKELNQIRLELRNSKVQGIVADSKIRSESLGLLFICSVRLLRMLIILF